MTTLEIDAPQLSATQLVARPGTLPTITIPISRGVPPDVLGIWEYLREPAEFFAVPMPGLDELAAVIAGSTGAAPAALSITIAEADGMPRILTSSTPVTPVRRVEVRLVGADPAVSTPHPTDPYWRRMAARTTSRGEADQLERWLDGRGYADAIAGDVPLLGALVLQTGSDLVGVENPEPTSMLDHLEQCGAISRIGRGGATAAEAERVWWMSPRYETFPVVEIDGTQLRVDPEVDPPFTRWS